MNPPPAPAAGRSVALALAAALLAAAPAPARAQSKSDAFAGRIPPIAGQLYRKAGRLELGLGGHLSVNDAFFNKYFGGAKLAWHLTEHWSVAASFAGGIARPAGSATVCAGSAGCTTVSDAQLWQVPGEITWIAGAEVAWAPIYGKLNPFSAWVIHFDLSALAGADLVTFRDVLARGPAEDLAAAGGTPGTKSAVGGHFGVGARAFLSEWIALRLEVKDVIYKAEVPNWQENGRARDNFENQIFTEVGLSFFVPPRNRRTR